MVKETEQEEEEEEEEEEDEKDEEGGMLRGNLATLNIIIVSFIRREVIKQGNKGRQRYYHHERDK